MAIISIGSEAQASSSYPDQFPISPLIRITLLSLYSALMVPLPFLAQVNEGGVSPWLLIAGIGLGALLLYGALGQRVHTDEAGISVTYPAWIRWLFRERWHLSWSDIAALKPRSTGQGGIVYYFVSKDQVSKDQQAYLLPMRIAGFARLVRQVQAETDIDIQDVKPLAQPWMYVILLGFTLLLGVVDIWTISTALQMQVGPAVIP